MTERMPPHGEPPGWLDRLLMAVLSGLVAATIVVAYLLARGWAP